MKQDAFERHNGPLWEQAEEWIRVLGAGRKQRQTAADAGRIGREFPALYRQICQHLAIARARRYGRGLQQRLNQLALDGHRHLYRPRFRLLSGIAQFLVHDFPAAFRGHGRFMLASTAMFGLCLLGMALATQLDGSLIYTLLNPADVAAMESMYDPGASVLGRERESETDVAMFGFYIYNNIGIGFRTFAGGLLFGIGSAFFLCFNGLFIGAIAGHLTSLGFVDTFWPFVVGHSSLELTAIVIFGAAGLSIGFSLLSPGTLTRRTAIVTAAKKTVPLVYGGTVMLVAAAFVEAFWSSTTWPPIAVKYAVGSVLWVLMILYFALLGRNESR